MYDLTLSKARSADGDCYHGLQPRCRKNTEFLCCAPQADLFFHGSAEDPQLLRRRSDGNSPMRGDWIAVRRKSGMQLRHFFVRANESFETFRGSEVCLLSAFGPLIESGGAEKEPQCGKLKIAAQLRRNLARVPAFRPTARIKRISRSNPGRCVAVS